MHGYKARYAVCMEWGGPTFNPFPVLKCFLVKEMNFESRIGYKGYRFKTSIFVPSILYLMLGGLFVCLCVEYSTAKMSHMTISDSWFNFDCFPSQYFTSVSFALLQSLIYVVVFITVHVVIIVVIVLIVFSCHRYCCYSYGWPKTSPRSLEMLYLPMNLTLQRNARKAAERMKFVT